MPGREQFQASFIQLLPADGRRERQELQGLIDGFLVHPELSRCCLMWLAMLMPSVANYAASGQLRMSCRSPRRYRFFNREKFLKARIIEKSCAGKWMRGRYR